MATWLLLEMYADCDRPNCSRRFLFIMPLKLTLDASVSKATCLLNIPMYFYTYFACATLGFEVIIRNVVGYLIILSTDTRD